MARLISRAELSRLAGVSDAMVSKVCKGRLLGACDGRRVDLDHPSVAEYLASRGRKVPDAQESTKKTPAQPTSPRPERTKRRAAAPLQATPEGEGSDEDLEELANLLRPLVERFGTATRFRDWLVALKTIEEIRAKRLDNEEHEGQLIERELVQAHVFGAIDATNRRLLSDFPKTIARELYTQSQTGMPIEKAEAKVRDHLGAQLKEVKSQASRALRQAA
jgi:hypothetical protein